MKFDRAASNTFGFEMSNSEAIFGLYDYTSRSFKWRATGGDLYLLEGGGNVGIGTSSPTTKLHVAGDITVDGNIAAKYQDVAEWVPSVQALVAGTVVSLDPERTNHVLASAKEYDTRVAGVVSAQPGLILGEGGAGKLKVATTGRDGCGSMPPSHRSRSATSS